MPLLNLPDTVVPSDPGLLLLFQPNSGEAGQEVYSNKGVRGEREGCPSEALQGDGRGAAEEPEGSLRALWGQGGAHAKSFRGR